MGARQQVVGFEGEPAPSAAGEPPAGQTRMWGALGSRLLEILMVCVRGNVWARSRRYLSCKAPL